jgi:hypothetical protein
MSISFRSGDYARMGLISTNQSVDTSLALVDTSLPALVLFFAVEDPKGFCILRSLMREEFLR